MIDLLTGNRRDDVTASVGELRVSKSGRFVVVVDYDRQHAVAVHCLDGLLRQLADDDVSAGITRRCRHFVDVQPRQKDSFPSDAFDDVCTRLSNSPSQPQPEITIDEFNQRCRLPPPPPVCTTMLYILGWIGSNPVIRGYFCGHVTAIGSAYL